MARRIYNIDARDFIDNVSAADLLVGARMLHKMVQIWTEQRRAAAAGDRLAVIECQSKMVQMLDAATVWRDTSGMKCRKRQAYRKSKLAALPHRVSRLDPRVDDDPNLVFAEPEDESALMASETSGDHEPESAQNSQSLTMEPQTQSHAKSHA